MVVFSQQWCIVFKGQMSIKLEVNTRTWVSQNGSEKKL